MGNEKSTYTTSCSPNFERASTISTTSTPSFEQLTEDIGDPSEYVSVRLPSSLRNSVDLQSWEAKKILMSVLAGSNLVVQFPHEGDVLMVKDDEAKDICNKLDEAAAFLGDVADAIRDEKRKRSLSNKDVETRKEAADNKTVNGNEDGQKDASADSAGKNNAAASMEILPVDLLVKTFSYLDCQDRIRVLRVSSRWRNLLTSAPLVQTVLINVENLKDKPNVYLINYLCKAVKRETRTVICYVKPEATFNVQTDSLLDGLDAILDGRARKLRKLRMANLFVNYDAIKHVLLHVDRLVLQDVVVGEIATGNYDHFHLRVRFGSIPGMEHDRSKALFEVFNNNCPMLTLEQVENLKQNMTERDGDQGLRMAGFLRRREVQFKDKKSAEIHLGDLDLMSLKPVTLVAFRAIMGEAYCNGPCCADGNWDNPSEGSEEDPDDVSDSSADGWTEESEDEDDGFDAFDIEND